MASAWKNWAFRTSWLTHVVGADPAVHNGWNGPYDVHDVSRALRHVRLFAAVTKRLELVTGVIILPQRQLVLVAKQAAEVDLLSGGRLRLGIGVGWNAVEYEALGEEFSNRGKRSAEQISLLRRLWTEQTVTFDGAFHRVTGAGIAPLPTQQPIPVWIGAASAPGFARAGRLADGWFPMMAPGPKLDEARAVVERAALGAGRDPASIGMEGRVDWRGDSYAVTNELAAWAEAGASHAVTRWGGLKSVDDHLGRWIGR
jgi:probable F420-dependent oxidoreductase